MKDISDSKTIDLIPVPKKRGRPSTGRAKSAAERMRDVRRRDVRKLGVDGQGFASMTLTGLYDHLRWSVKHGHVSDIQRICDELKGRATAHVEAAHVEAAHVEASQVEASQVEPSVPGPGFVTGQVLLLDGKETVTYKYFVPRRGCIVSQNGVTRRVAASRLSIPC